LSINFAALKKLGSIMFLAGTLGIIIGGPFALYIVGSFYPEVALSNGKVERVINNCEVDWLWCKSNLMLEVFGKQKYVCQMIAVLVANLWMGFYFMGSNQIKLTNG
jgi:hypothetical protein